MKKEMNINHPTLLAATTWINSILRMVCLPYFDNDRNAAALVAEELQRLSELNNGEEYSELNTPFGKLITRYLRWLGLNPNNHVDRFQTHVGQLVEFGGPDEDDARIPDGDGPTICEWRNTLGLYEVTMWVDGAPYARFTSATPLTGCVLEA